MDKKKWLGITLGVVGVATFASFIYIQSQIDAGQQKIQKVQKSVDRGNKILSLTPATKELGDNLSKPIQKKIDDGQQTIEHYQTLANYLKISGAIAMCMGVLLLIWSCAAPKRP